MFHNSRAGVSSSLGPLSCPYSPKCLEEVFSEIRLITFNTNITHLRDVLNNECLLQW
jgi:hypothetical protein